MKIRFSRRYMLETVRNAKTLIANVPYRDPENIETTDACPVGEIAREAALATGDWLAVVSRLSDALRLPDAPRLSSVNDTASDEERKALVLDWLEKHAPDVVEFEI